jgi:hypothetical protein
MSSVGGTRHGVSRFVGAHRRLASSQAGMTGT